MFFSKVGPQEADLNNKMSEQDNERVAMEALIDYAIQCANETHFVGSGDAMEAAKRQLTNSLFY
ncbi:hypothetical protein DL239_01000 [Sedimentitalea sp. CY04]|uniref:Uncharacterized protein n=1 Tax=Parasedimentitalea denitrificans TaxID=2211118 RepID=A0ABX0W3M4_9RHOB|nr:hypothetical protein [Sedimentitalea sp. CY04]NIZ59548.1 hypothetical protein [Sedimentitalea sp. CY04]